MNMNNNVSATDLWENTQTPIKFHLEWLLTPKGSKRGKMDFIEEQ